VSRVLIADDHAVVRAGFKQFLEADSSINAVGEAASGNETLDQLRQHEWIWCCWTFTCPIAADWTFCATFKPAIPASAFW